MHIHTPQSACRFGVARCEVTPPVGIYHRLWGAATHERATGVHRPLSATAAVFQACPSEAAGDSEQVLIAVDHCLLMGPEMDELLDLVATQSNTPRRRIVVAFSHTHSAGLMDKSRAGLPGGELIGPYLDQLARQLGAIVREAREGIRPAIIVYGSGHCRLAAQRDFADRESGQWVCGLNPDGLADDTVLVARVTASAAPDGTSSQNSDGQGGILATFVNYACHPTTLAWENQLISPDFPGALRETVEQETEVPCVFLQGASGDLGPREGYVGDTAVADRNGRQLGFAALAVLEGMPPPGTRFQYTGPVISGATLGAWEHIPLSDTELSHIKTWRMNRFAVSLPYRPGLATPSELTEERARWREAELVAERAANAIAARDCHALVERVDRQLRRLSVLPEGAEFPLPVTLWQMGTALWLAVEAEHYQLLQQRLREEFSGLPIMVMTLANGSRACYLPTAQVYDTGIYQDSIALLAKGSLERLIEAIAERIRTWRNFDAR